MTPLSDALARAGRRAARRSAPLDTAAAQAVQAVIRAYLAEQRSLDAADALLRAALPVLGWQRQAGMDGGETWVLPTLWIGASAQWLTNALSAARHAAHAITTRWLATRDPATVLLDLVIADLHLATLRFDRATSGDLLVWIAHTGTISLLARDDVPPPDMQGAVIVRLAGVEGALLETDRAALRELEPDAVDRPRA